MGVDATNVDVSTAEKLLWVLAVAVVVALAVPWFLWRDATVIAGLPAWIWWHIAWMGVASLVFYGFSRRAWGLGVEL
ncbi:DUF3311 domain-containing protein [Halosegnis longus]|uniref:DUF3311 domain-containing protein n=1 Tax=Halosegnis longus TaxID=2216012 RepID=A0AAJ4R7J2_9EURY|nr:MULTISPECIES: DUF3311 domain-containing protein [Halobacteriales]RNJ25675.1 DUF3311 domain-containing protein [Salella cibi]